MRHLYPCTIFARCPISQLHSLVRLFNKYLSISARMNRKSLFLPHGNQDLVEEIEEEIRTYSKLLSNALVV